MEIICGKLKYRLSGADWLDAQVRHKEDPER